MRRVRLPRRPGAAAAEAAVVLPVFFLIVFAMLDLSICLLRNEMLSEISRTGARIAITHGVYAKDGWNGGSWGPTTITAQANTSGTPIVDALKPYMVGFDLSATTVKVEWLDNSNSVQSRVRVTVTTTYKPVLSFVLGSSTIYLSGSSTMPIAH